MPAIVVDELVKTYKGNIKAVDSITFQVEKGEIFGFLGPNGAGKTTTIKMLNTLLKPTSGRAVVGGFDVIKQPRQVRDRIGYVAQDLGVDESATGRENLSLYGHLYRLNSKTVGKRVEELIEMVGLSGNEDRLVSTYSGGMRRRLDIAMGLIHHPEILFLDEPTGGLDPQTRVHIWDYIQKLSREDGMSIFLTTHYMDEADHLANRIAIIDHGQLVTVGTPAQLKSDISGDVVTLNLAGEHSDEIEVAIQQTGDVLKEQPFVKQIQRKDSDLNAYVDGAEYAIPQIMRILESKGISVKTISLARPSLDDVFLKHTGRTIREGEGKRTPWAQSQKRGSTRR